MDFIMAHSLRATIILMSIILGIVRNPNKKNILYRLISFIMVFVLLFGSIKLWNIIQIQNGISDAEEMTIEKRVDHRLVKGLWELSLIGEKGNLEITRKPISLKTCNATYNKEEQTLLSSPIEYNVENSPLKKTNVGEYKVNLTPNSNYMWNDNTTTSKEVTCSILPKELDTSKFSVSNNIKVFNQL